MQDDLDQGDDLRDEQADEQTIDQLKDLPPGGYRTNEDGTLTRI